MLHTASHCLSGSDWEFVGVPMSLYIIFDLSLKKEG